MKKLPYLYLLRVPILVGAVLFLFPVVALWPGSPAQPLFENLFELDFWGTAITVMLGAVVSWSLLLTGRIILFNGRERFGTAQIGTEANADPKSGIWVALIAFPLSFGQFLRPEAFGLTVEGKITHVLWINLAGVATGFVSAYILAYLAMLLAVVIAPPGTQALAMKFLAPARLQNWLVIANTKSLLSPARWEATGRVLAQRVPRWLRAGYLDSKSTLQSSPGLVSPANRCYGLPYSGHWLALTFAIVTAIVCSVIDIYKLTFLGEDTFLPALLFVLILLLGINWILSAMTFFFDRFRIPLLIPLAILSAFGAHSPSSDHYFEVTTAAAIKPISPGEALYAQYERRQSACSATLEKLKQNVTKQTLRDCALSKPFIVVATAGGGIQAASWTTQVLTGLERESQKWGKGGFADSVVLISSVSGGAAGSMFYLHQYGAPDSANPSGFKLRPQEFNSLVELASKSSLEDVAWALVYRDIPRIVTPYGKSEQQRLLDRGRMLEVNWQQRANLYARLSQWKVGVLEGWRPAAIFNSTIAETGEPLLFQTTEFQKKGSRNAGGTPIVPERRSFYDFLQGADVPIVTAVRLAATFPYVTPAARPATDGPQYHLIDGGYYDNYGVASAVEWIDEALSEFTGLPEFKNEPSLRPTILVLQIRSFPNDSVAAAKNRGWFFQTYAPLEGVVGARTTSQLVRDHDALLRLQRLWSPDPNKVPNIRFAGFQFTSADAPLSWSMTRRQIKSVQDEWESTILKPQQDWEEGHLDRTRERVSDDLQQVRCLFDDSIEDKLGMTGKNCDQLGKTKEPW